MNLSSAWRWLGGAMVAALILTLGLSTLVPQAVAQNGTPSSGSAQCAAATPAASPAANAEATSTASPQASPAAENCVTIGMNDIYFDPNLVTIPANTPVTIVLPNKGATMHNFSVNDRGNADVQNLNINVDVPAGETKTVTVNAPAGTYYFYCNVPGHEAAGMFGYLVVKENAKIASERATVTPPAGA